MNEAKAIKRHAAQHDLFNRLHSIAADEHFVRTVAQKWFDGRFEVVANQRCGTWYCDPATSSNVYAYFKSTDGHTLNWDFNLRRSNLSLATHAEDSGGFLLIDSTRRGKRMPDGLSKTVPIWCAVVNRALSLRRQAAGSPEPEGWDTNLYLPAQIVSPSECAQIEAKLDCWAEALESSVLPLPDLKKPLHPFFVHPATSYPPHISPSPAFTPIICVSASRWINDTGRGDVVPTATHVGDGMFSRTVAFDYVPGAGDDDELWGQGLKPALYHKHKADLLSTPRDELPDVVDDLVEEARDLSRAFNSLSVEPSDGSESPVEGIWTTSIYVAPNLRLDLGEPIQNPTTITRSEDKTLKVTVRVVEVYKPLKDTPCVLPVDVAKTTPVFMFALPSPRSHGKDFIIALGSLVTKLRALASQSITLQVLLSPGREEELTTAVDIYKKGVSSNSGERQTSLRNSLPSSSSLTGPELQAARKAIIPVAIALLSAIPGLEDRVDEGELDVDKAVIADYLHTLVALWPDGNVQRAALKRLNEFLMSSDYR